MANVTIGQLEKMEATQLDDDDLLIIWDTNAHHQRQELMEKHGATKNLPNSSKSIRLADLRDFILNAPPENTGERCRWAAEKNAKKCLEEAFMKGRGI